MKDGELHITCDCHAHELHIERDDISTPGGTTTKNWYVSFWQCGYHSTVSWRWQLKCIWKILQTGTPYGDEVILSRSQMQELYDYIKKELNDDQNIHS